MSVVSSRRTNITSVQVYVTRLSVYRRYRSLVIVHSGQVIQARTVTTEDALVLGNRNVALGLNASFHVDGAIVRQRELSVLRPHVALVVPREDTPSGVAGEHGHVEVLLNIVQGNPHNAVRDQPVTS